MKYLFICTGNTCRSPMAEALAKKLFSFHEFSSAGLFTAEGSSASLGAINAMKRFDIDISSHESKQFTFEMAKDFDYIIPMTKQHKLVLLSNMIDEEKIISFENEVADPFMCDDSVYYECANQIKINLEKLFGECNAN